MQRAMHSGIVKVKIGEIAMTNEVTRFKLKKGNCTTATRSILAVSVLRSKGWVVVQSTFGELI